MVHAPGFEGKYSLDVVYFETRQYPNSTNAKGKFTGTRTQHHTRLTTHTTAVVASKREKSERRDRARTGAGWGVLIIV